MSDQELRDKLASKARPLGKLLSPYEQDLWCDGWDAARTNPLAQTVNLNAQGLEATVKGTVDQLRAEVERLNLLNAELKVTVLENDEFWIKECEKLAAALESVVPKLQELSKILKDNALDEKQGIAEHDACLIACGFLKGDIEEALAEYRKETDK